MSYLPHSRQCTLISLSQYYIVDMKSAKKVVIFITTHNFLNEEKELGVNKRFYLSSVFDKKIS